MNNKMLAIKKDGRYYFQPSPYLPLRVEYGDILKVNGVPVNQCPGNSRWYFADAAQLGGAPQVVSIQKPQTTEPSHYELKPEFSSLSHLSPTVELDFFVYDDDDERKNDEIFGLYQMVRRVVPSHDLRLEDVTVDIVDEDCEPITLAFEVISKFPYALDFHPVSYYKYPCAVSSKESFRYVTRALKERIAQQGNSVEVSYTPDYSFYVKQSLPVEHQENVVSKTGRSGGRGKVTVSPLRSIQRSLIELKMGDLPQLEAENYFALKAKLDAYVEERMKALDGGVKVCRYCKGYGVLTANDSAITSDVART